MKKNNHSTLLITALFLMLFVTLKSYAGDYTISFTGTGASTSVSSIIVQNLTQSTTTTVPGGNVLTLTVTPNAVDQLSANNEGIRIYPNPMQGKSTVSFYAKQAGNALINVFGIDGRQMVGINKNLQEGENSFFVSLPKGVYAIRVAGNEYSYAAKVISQTNLQNKPEITFTGNEKPVSSAPQKIKSAVTSMPFTEGDRLLFKGISGNYSTIVTDIPTQSKTVTFSFVDCTDADGNHYPVVQIGTQIWMAENLKNTKYRNGEAIPNVTDNTAWSILRTGAYCDYDNRIEYSAIYGKLYNWHAVHDSRNLAPVGWHIPNYDEWTRLTNYLGGSDYAGQMLKDITNWTFYSDIVATNETGFTALPGGDRNYSSGSFNYIEEWGSWWSSLEYTIPSAYAVEMRFDYSILVLGKYYKEAGFSVRCLSDVTLAVSLPPVNTTSVINTTATTSISGGVITRDGGSTVTARGVCWSTGQSPTIADAKTTDGSGVGSFTSNLINLSPNTKYYVRAYATNSAGTVYGSTLSFTTKNGIIILTTNDVKPITSIKATCGGNILDDGGATITARGICWSTSQLPTIIDNKTTESMGVGRFASTITGLILNTTYYVRAYATNIFGTAYGSSKSITPLPSTNTVTDIDGNVYNTVIIGTQVWMIENLKTTKYNDGADIPNINDNNDWANAYMGGYCWYNNNSSIYKATYGAMYNRHALDTYKLCPVGWHVPTIDDWGTLQNYLGGEGLAGGQLKEAGSLNWESPNEGAFNESNFSALPGGYRSHFNGNFSGLGVSSSWWIDYKNYLGDYFCAHMFVNSSELTFEYLTDVNDGYYVRCIRDDPSDAVIPILNTSAVSNITSASAICGGNITSNGKSVVSARGVCWNTTENPTLTDNKTTDGTGIGVFTSNLTNLTGSKTYYVRAYATNGVGTAYGIQISFATTVDLANVTTSSITNVTSTSAICGGNITNDGGANITERGVCFNTSPNPNISNSKLVIGSGIGTFSNTITGLTANTTYYVRAYATNSVGTGYGSELSFRTYQSNSQIVTDIDGNVYHSVTIGAQVWLVENLKTTKYNDGTAIPLVTDNTAWTALSTPAFCWYNNDAATNKNMYGALYNWYAVNTGKLAPTGWHVASKVEWTTLENYLILNGYNYDGTTIGDKIAKSLAATTNWNSDSGTGTIGNDLTQNNSSGFTALPGGYRYNTGGFYIVGDSGLWWSSTEYNSTYAWRRTLSYNYNLLGTGIYDTKKFGCSVRCIKD